MKKKYWLLVLGLCLSLSALKVKAGQYEDFLDVKYGKQLDDYLFGMRYRINQGTMTLSGNATFYGHASAISLKANGGTVNWTLFESSRTEGIFQQGVLYSGDSFSQDFSKLVGSPTIITATFESGTTLQWFIGGLKR